MIDEIKRIFDLLPAYKQKFPKDDVLAAKKNGKWVKYSIDDYINYADYFSIGLISLGLTKGDKIATISNNRPEWNFVDMGMAQIGVVHVPVYPTISFKEYEHILKHSDAKMLIVSDRLIFKKINKIVEKLGNITYIYSFNEIQGVNNWQEIIDLGKKNYEQYHKKLDDLKNTISEDDLCSIIYTSGTTGMPKGVMLSHRNFVSNFKGGYKALPLNHKHKALSFLPLCHVYERTMTYLYQYAGVSIYYAQNMGTIANDLKDIKADGFDTVPRLLEKVYDSIMAKGANLTGITKKIFDWSVKIALRYEFGGKNGIFYEFQRKIADVLVYKKWREALGGNIKFVGSGGAPLQERLNRFFWCAKIPIHEGYGLTETSPLIAFNYAYLPMKKMGTVGPIIEGVQVKIAEDGEILVKGPNVMMGYYKEPDRTKDVIDEQGWFHTGDVGEMVDGKFLKITDRKKEIFKLSSGKYVAPQVIENLFKQSIYIEQLMVVGEKQKIAAAIISPDFKKLTVWAKEKNIDFENQEDLIQNKQVIKFIGDLIKNFNQQLAPHENIKRFRLVADEWTPENGLLSPTLKLKRKVLKQKYQTLIDEIYNK